MSVPQLAVAITPFITKFNGKRIPITYDVNKRPVYGTPVAFTTKGSLQEATAKDLQMVPEGEYSEEIFVYYSKDALLSGSDDGVQTPDQIIFNGQNYKIIQKAQWQIHGYYKYFVRKLDVGVL